MKSLSKKNISKIFCDTNIFQDVLSRRTGWEESFFILDFVKQQKIAGVCSVLSVPILWYLNRKTENRRERIKDLLQGFQMATLDAEMTWQVLTRFELKDLEDELQYQSALQHSCAYFITRNIKDFPTGKLDILSPPDFLEQFQNTQ